MKYLIVARRSLTTKVIVGGWRHTGNWPINRQKALSHPEIQEEKKRKMDSEPREDDDDHEPVTHGYVTKLGRGKGFEERMKFRKIANHVESQAAQIVLQKARIEALEAQLEEINKGEKRRAIPNPNQRFQTLTEILSGGGNLNEPEEEPEAISSSSDNGVEDEDEKEEVVSEAESIGMAGPGPATKISRRGREIRAPAQYHD